MSLRLAWRGALRNPRRTAVVVTAVAVGIWGSLVSMALNFGMVVGMVDTAIATELGHLQIHARGYEAEPVLETRLSDGGLAAMNALSDREGLHAWSPRIRGQGLLNSPHASVGVRVVAVDPGREPAVSLLSDSVVEGEWLIDDAAQRVLLGHSLANRLQVGVGRKIVLSVQDLEGNLTGRAVRVGGIFATPSDALDRATVVMRLTDAQSLFGLGDAISEIVVLVEDRATIDDLAGSLAQALGADAEVRSWEELQPMLVYMVNSFDTMAWYIYGAVFVAMSFGIANVLLMAVYERTREIGMMMAMGMKRSRVVTAVVLESMFVTGLGLAIGVAASVGTVWWLGDGIDLSGFSEALTAYGIGTRIVPVLRMSDLGIPLMVAGIAALLASSWPALRAAGLRPSEALRRG